MNAKRIIIVVALWGFLFGYPIVGSQSIGAWLQTLIAGFVSPILGAGFAQFTPILTYGGTFAVLFFALDKIGPTKAYSVPAAN